MMRFLFALVWIIIYLFCISAQLSQYDSDRDKGHQLHNNIDEQIVSLQHNNNTAKTDNKNLLLNISLDQKKNFNQNDYLCFSACTRDCFPSCDRSHDEKVCNDNCINSCMKSCFS